MRNLEELLDLVEPCQQQDEEFRNRQWNVCQGGMFLLDCDHDTFHQFTGAIILTTIEQQESIILEAALTVVAPDAESEDRAAFQDALTMLFLRGVQFGQVVERAKGNR